MKELMITGNHVHIAFEESGTHTEARLVLPAPVANRDSGRYLPSHAQPGDHAFFCKNKTVYT